jgi:plastocyanin
MKGSWRKLAVSSKGLLLVVSVVLLVPLWIGPASAPQADAQTADQKEASIAIKTFQFRPTPLAVKAGTRVVWTNTDDIEHTVTAGTPESRAGWFNSKLSEKGTTFSFTFTQPGTYQYFCDRHHSMRGEIWVQ